MTNNQSPNSFSYLRQIFMVHNSASDLYSGRDESPKEREYNKAVKCSLWCDKPRIISYNDTCPSYFVNVILVIITIIIGVIITIIIRDQDLPHS